MRDPAVASVLSLVLVAGAAAQTPGDRPTGWLVRTDDPAHESSEVTFVDMPPGWHITTGPAAILWSRSLTARGEFAVESEVYLFDPTDRREGFGVFVGGTDLASDEPAYLYFLLREGGQFLIKERRGEQTRTLVDWSSAPSMVSYATRPEDSATAKNVLRIEADASDVRFVVNGEEVARLDRADVAVDGSVGFRVNHRLNLHVARLEVVDGTSGM